MTTHLLNPGSSVNTLYWPSTSAATHTTSTTITASSSSSSIIDHGLKITLNASSSSGTQRLADPRNADLLVFIGDRLFPREHAKISVLDSSVQGGDAVWEGLRVYSNKIFKLEEHLQRLMVCTSLDPPSCPLSVWCTLLTHPLDMPFLTSP